MVGFLTLSMLVSETYAGYCYSGSDGYDSYYVGRSSYNGASCPSGTYNPGCYAGCIETWPGYY